MVRLGQVHCVQKVIQYKNSGVPFRTWACTEDDCSSCTGEKCDELTTRVLIKGEGEDDL